MDLALNNLQWSICHKPPHTHIYIYIYRERERERERWKKVRGLIGIFLRVYFSKLFTPSFVTKSYTYICACTRVRVCVALTI